MSKYLKQLITSEIAHRLEGIDECLLVNVIGLEVNSSVLLRRQLREKDIQLMVVKNSMIRRATEGTPLATALEGIEGSLAICWGGDDFISLAKEIARFDKDRNQFEAFQTRGGVMDGEQLTPEAIREISMWPTRDEQLSILLGQILGVGSRLSSQLIAPGGLLSSQFENFPEDAAGDTEAEAEEPAGDAADDTQAEAEEPAEDAADDTQAEAEEPAGDAADDTQAEAEEPAEDAADDTQAEAEEDHTED
jgi:large subunit ribosomal protein L10